MRATQSMLSKGRHRRKNSVRLACVSICSVLVVMQILLSRQQAQQETILHDGTPPAVVSSSVAAGSTNLWKSFRDGDLGRLSSIRSVYINATTATSKLSSMKVRTDSSRSEQQQHDKSVSSSSSSNATTSQRPTLVIHIGPPKTGSTFLQCSLCGRGGGSNNQLLDVLSQQDSYVFLGTCPWRMCGLPQEPTEEQYLPHRFDAFLTTNLGYTKLIGPKLHEWSENVTKRRSLLKPSFVRKLALLRQQQPNVNGLVIFEGLSKFEPFLIHKLASVLTQLEWKVKIVVAYRPLWSWLPSKYNSITKVSKNPSARHWLNHEQCNQTRSSHCKRIEPFDLDDRGKFSDYVQYLEQQQLHPSHMMYLNFVKAFDDVQLVPLHQLDAHGLGDPLLEHFFCRILPNAVHTCRRIRAGDYDHDTGAIRNLSDLITHEYDRLVVEAHSQGLYRGSLSRAVLRQWALYYQQYGLHRALDDFPRICLPQSTLDRLEHLSWNLERNFFFNNATTTTTWTTTTTTTTTPAAPQRELHQQGFRQVVEAQRIFCSMDLNQTLQDPKWQSFFANPYCVNKNHHNNNNNNATTTTNGGEAC